MATALSYVKVRIQAAHGADTLAGFRA